MKSLHILLVEDDAIAAYITKEALENASIQNTLTVVHDGDDAISYLRRRGDFSEATKPDLVILDLNMPKKNGLEVLEEMRSDSDFKNMPVIILTTSSAEKDIEETFRANASCYITKPFEESQFLRAIEIIQKSYQL